MNRPWQVTVAPKGLVFSTDGSSTVLLAAAQGGVQLPSSCRNGTCRTCICQLTSGSVRYTIDWPGLTPEERASGCVLPRRSSCAPSSNGASA